MYLKYQVNLLFLLILLTTDPKQIEMTNKNKGKNTVTVYPAWCKGCGLCVEFCPGNVLALNQEGKAEVVQEKECVNCGFCEYHCPDFAIAVTPKKQKSNAREAQDPASDAENSATNQQETQTVPEQQQTASSSKG